MTKLNSRVIFSSLVAFFPPDQLPVGSLVLYVTLVIVGTVVFCGIPLILHGIRRPNWVRDVQTGRIVWGMVIGGSRGEGGMNWPATVGEKIGAQ